MNVSLFTWFNSFAGQSNFFDWFVTFCAVTLSFLVIAGVVIFMLIHTDDRYQKGNMIQHIKQRIPEIALVFIATLFAWGISDILKHLFHIARPFITLPHVHTLFTESNFSFPSMHATFFAALTAAVYLYHRKAGVVLAICTFFIGIARIIAGVHYPFDIFVGFILGAVISALVYRLLSKLWARHKGKVDYFAKNL